MYKTQTRDMFLLKFLDWRSRRGNSNVSLGDLTNELRTLQHETGLDVYAFPEQATAYTPQLLSDLSRLEKEGLVKARRRSEPHYNVSPLGEYFCSLMETPEILNKYSDTNTSPKTC